MALYALTSDPRQILREADGVLIPTDPANADYVAYLAWLAVPNTPDPAPVPTAAQVALASLEVNDGLMFRALELLIDILITKGVIVAADVTPTVRALYLARKTLRVTAGLP
jgi:hypothetical protein